MHVKAVIPTYIPVLIQYIYILICSIKNRISDNLHYGIYLKSGGFMLDFVFQVPFLTHNLERFDIMSYHYDL